MIVIALSALFACGTDSETAEVMETAPTSEALELVETTESPPVEELAAIDLELVLDTDVELEESIEAIAPEAVDTYSVAVRSGENLVLIADWGDVTVEELLAVNDDMDPSDPIFAGQSIALPGGEEESIQYTAERQAFVDAKLERYMSRRGGLVGVDEHRVRTGDTASQLADEIAEIPMWVLSEFNRDKDLDRLAIGDRVNLPVLGDTVEVDLEEDIGSMEPGEYQE